MGRRVRAGQKARRRGVGGWPRHPAPSEHHPHGRRRQPKEIPPLGAVFAKTVRHFAPDLPKVIEALPDHRKAEDVLYPKANVVWSGILMFLLGLGSRRQFRFESDSAAFVANLNAVAGSSVETAPHDDSIVYYLEPLEPGPFAELPAHLTERLIRMKALDPWRVLGAHAVAVDGTGQYFYRTRHCPFCLTQKASNGETLYFHHVLEAKLVTANGFAFSLGTEFIENRDPKATKQDCELKAFERLAETLHARFPRLPLLFLFDALYANQTVFTIAERYRWHFIVTFKPGSFPALFPEYERLRDLEPRNRVERTEGQVSQHFAWVNDLDHEGHRLCAFECREAGPERERYGAWLTDIPLGKASVITAAKGGRLRWKIENEGFNTQKNSGYALEHAYSKNDHAVKIFYYLLQVAHALNQLMTKGSLLRGFGKLLGSFRNYLRRLAEALRTQIIPPEAWDPIAARSIQIRFDSP